MKLALTQLLLKLPFNRIESITNYHIIIMSLARVPVFVVGAKRTAFGAFGGKLKEISATDLAVHSSKAAIAHAGLKPEKVQET